jgi:hypothetical protein
VGVVFCIFLIYKGFTFMAVIKNEGTSSGEFEKRIGNLNGIERIFDSGSVLRLWLTTGERRVAQLYMNNTGLANGPGVGMDLETALVNLDRLCFDQEYVQPEYTTGTNIADKGNNIEKWLKNRGNILIRQEPEGAHGQKFAVFEDNKILSYLVDHHIRSASSLNIVAHIYSNEYRVANVLSSINSEIIPALFELVPEKVRTTSQKPRRGRRE